MQPHSHLVLSAAAGAAVWGATGEPLSIPLALAAGVLVDVDHVPDMVVEHVLDRTPRLTLGLHGWEWLLSLVAAGAWLGFPWWLIAIGAAYALHLGGDALFNGLGASRYSLLYRAARLFDRAGLVAGSYRRPAAVARPRRR